MKATTRPAARRSSAPPDAASSGRRPAFGAAVEGPLVLLVDDAEDVRAAYADYFASFGFRVVQAVDGEHALLKILALMPDLVVMDLTLPVLDGWEATHQLKTNAKTKHIPVIVLTGHATPRGLERASHAGADALLIKPCAPDALLAVAQRLLAEARPA